MVRQRDNALHIRNDYVAQMPFAEDNEMIKTFPLDHRH